MKSSPKFRIGDQVTQYTKPEGIHRHGLTVIGIYLGTDGSWTYTARGISSMALGDTGKLVPTHGELSCGEEHIHKMVRRK